VLFKEITFIWYIYKIEWYREDTKF